VTEEGGSAGARPADATGVDPAQGLHGRPTAQELVEAVRGFLRDQIAPRVDEPLQYQVRVAVHALEIVARELALGPAQRDAHRERLADLGAADDADLATAIRHGRLDDSPALRAALRADTRDRLLVANPGWLPP
jgi:Domain of unknown function (DUF6285)